MSRVGDQESPKWVAYNYRDELVRAMKQIEDLQLLSMLPLLTFTHGHESRQRASEAHRT